MCDSESSQSAFKNETVSRVRFADQQNMNTQTHLAEIQIKHPGCKQKSISGTQREKTRQQHNLTLSSLLTADFITALLLEPMTYNNNSLDGICTVVVSGLPVLIRPTHSVEL